MSANAHIRPLTTPFDEHPAAEPRHLPDGFALALTATPDAPARARRVLGDALAHWDRTQRDAALLVISELVTNAIRHGSESQDDEVILRLRRPGRATRIEVVDPGARGGFAPDAPERATAAKRASAPKRAAAPERTTAPERAAAPERTIAPERTGAPTDARSGWGLPIVSELTDRWGVETRDDGTCVWCELDLV